MGARRHVPGTRAVPTLGELGLLELQYDPDYGGQGPSWRTASLTHSAGRRGSSTTPVRSTRGAWPTRSVTSALGRGSRFGSPPSAATT